MIYVVGIIIIWIVYQKLTAPKVEMISKDELQTLMKNKKGYHFIDVRTTSEFNSNKIKGFKNMPLQSLRNKLEILPLEDNIVLLCASGHRSMSAAKVLSKAGYKNLINVKGGLSRMT